MYLQNVFSRVASVVSALTMLCFVACGGEYTGYKVILPEQPDMAVPPSVDMVMAPDMHASAPVIIDIKCMINGGCEYKLFGRTPDDKGYYWIGKADDGQTFTIETDYQWVCGRTITDGMVTRADGSIVDNSGMKVNGVPTSLVYGLELAVRNRTGWLTYSGTNPSAVEAVRVNLRGSALVPKENITLVPIEFPKRGEVTALIREQFISACTFR